MFVSEKRVCERIPVRLEAITTYGNLFHSGIIMNLSENGIFIRTRKIFPVDSLISVHIQKEHMHLFSRVKRFEISGNNSFGIGVEIIHAQLHYNELIDGLRAGL